jgi:hypothetical protein
MSALCHKQTFSALFDYLIGARVQGRRQPQRSTLPETARRSWPYAPSVFLLFNMTTQNFELDQNCPHMSNFGISRFGINDEAACFAVLALVVAVVVSVMTLKQAINYNCAASTARWPSI